MDQKVMIMAILILVGIVLVALAASADYTKLNVTQSDRDTPEFGWVQTLSLLGGCGIVVAGGVFGVVSRKKATEEEEDVEEPEEEESSDADDPGLLDEDELTDA